jgi:HTH-type transcriptional regulator / antitoxin HipB
MLHSSVCRDIHLPMRIKSVGTIGELVRDQRKQRGWSQTQLALKADVSRLWIGHLEKGKETVELGLVLKTLRALEINLEAFLQSKTSVAAGS